MNLDIYSIRRCCRNVATFKWKIHIGKIKIVSFVSIFVHSRRRFQFLGVHVGQFMKMALLYLWYQLFESKTHRCNQTWNCLMKEHHLCMQHNVKDKFEGIKGIIINRKYVTDRQHNGQKKQDKGTNNELQKHYKEKIGKPNN